MRLRIPIVILLIGIIGVIINLWVIDWESQSTKKINSYFDDLITQQRTDLSNWTDQLEVSGSFSKRIYCHGELTRWSDDIAWPSADFKEGTSVVNDETGIYLMYQRSINRNCYAISIYPLTKNYSITNRYLKSRKNVDLPKSLTAIDLDTGDHQFKNLFYFNIDEVPSKGLNVLFGVLIFASLMVILWWVLTQYFIIGVLLVISLRLASLYAGLLEAFIKYPLFDSIYYTSSVISPTIGDLFLNALLIFVVTLSWSRRFREKQMKVRSIDIYGPMLFGMAISSLVFSTLWSILDNSQISLDVGKSIEFNLLRIVSYLIVLLLVASQFLLTFRLVGSLSQVKNKRIFYGVLFGIPLLILLFALPEGLTILSFSAIVLLGGQLGWGTRLKEFKYENLLFTLVISVSLAGVMSFTVYKFHEKSELEAKKKFANHLLIKRDVLGEYYLNELVSETRRRAESGLTGWREAIQSQVINPYFDKYQVQVVDSLSDPGVFKSLKSKLSTGQLSDYTSIYFIDEGTEFSYICDLGQYLVSLRLKRRVPSSVFPALLTDNKYFTPSDDFDYAVFRNGEILFQRSKFGQGEWPEEQDFKDPRIYNEGIEKNERHYLGVETMDGRVILIISSKYNVRMQLTNFSFFFLLLFFFLGSIVLVSSLNLRKAQLNFTGKIQLYLGLAFIIPLFLAGFALLNSLNNSYREEIDRNYLKRSLYMSALLSEEMQGDIFNLSSEQLALASNFMQADLTIYDAKGRLVSTSQPEIFSLGLQSALVNPIVFNELLEKENQSMITDEVIGGLDYKVSYATLNDENDNVTGFIAIPFFDSKNHLKRQQLEVFGSLLSIFGFIFILAILFGNLVLNNLMKPLRMVADKIREITLQEENKPIVYESSDEIGSLVRDYNSMLVKLEDSKRALARSQKETAWKEIARQVAHEIKNPLTPMQLKIQQLLRKHEEGSKDHEALSALLHQVDTLSQIASSFSAFADMPVPNNELFDFSKLVNQVVSLYHSDDVSIETSIEEEVMINADKDIFQRILNNIVLNALQSVKNEQPKIEVNLIRRSGKCELSVKDNGKGIPAELRDKIFMNYFSTKSSGSGIGLALAKKGIENAGGNIWFESQADEGTTFFISMPMAAT